MGFYGLPKVRTENKDIPDHALVISIDFQMTKCLISLYLSSICKVGLIMLLYRAMFVCFFTTKREHIYCVRSAASTTPSFSLNMGFFQPLEVC